MKIRSQYVRDKVAGKSFNSQEAGRTRIVYGVERTSQECGREGRWPSAAPGCDLFDLLLWYILPISSLPFRYDI